MYIFFNFIYFFQKWMCLTKYVYFVKAYFYIKQNYNKIASSKIFLLILNTYINFILIIF
jgi:hypothetical protein